jgi:hypothetical protein
MGIWPDGSDGTDVNAVDRAAVGQPLVDSDSVSYPEGDAGLEHAGYVVTADDFGKIKLFNYPCVFNDAPFREYKGHASHAMCARFTCDDRRVITAGGRDRAMLQFITKGVRIDEPAPEYEPPPPETREWGPIDGGKGHGLDRARAGREGDQEARGGATERAAQAAAGDDGVRRRRRIDLIIYVKP